MSAPIHLRKMSDEEREAAQSLKTVRFPPDSWDQRFARSLLGQGEWITEGQAPQVWRLFKKYRRQIQCEHKDSLLRLAEQLGAPDYRAQARAMRAAEQCAKLRADYERARQGGLALA